MDLRHCARCDQMLPRDNFYRTRSGYCKSCHRSYLQDRHRTLMAEVCSGEERIEILPQPPSSIGMPPLPPMQLSSSDAAYFVGILDGEGSIVLHVGGGQVTLYLMVANTSPKLMDWLYSHVGGYVRNQSQRGASFLSRRPMYRWQMGGAMAGDLLRRLRRKFVIKDLHARIALDAIKAWQEGNKKNAIQATRDIRRLNTWGRRLSTIQSKP